MFKSELAEYKAEGVPTTEINYQDNQIILDLIEGEGGLLSILDDATTGVALTGEKYTSKAIRTHEKHPHFCKPRFGQATRWRSVSGTSSGLLGTPRTTSW